MYASRFYSRVQGDLECAQNYAKELKRLHNKAYSHRDTQTREEDLVHRFLEGMRNDDMRFAIEFHKDQKTIDESVYHCVEYDALRSWIFEDTHPHKTASKQGRELYRKNENEEIINCCDPKGSKVDVKQSHAEIFEMVLQLGELLHKLIHKVSAIAAQTQVKQIEEELNSQNSFLRSAERVNHKPEQELNFSGDCQEMFTNETSQYECSADVNKSDTIPFCRFIDDVSMNNRKSRKTEPGPSLIGGNDGKEEPSFRCQNDGEAGQTATRRYTFCQKHDSQQIRHNCMEYQNIHVKQDNETETEK